MTIIRLAQAGRFAPRRLFHPESVAVIGAACPIGAQVLGNLRAGFAGAVWEADNPAKLPGAPDLALIAETRDASAALRGLAARGTGAAIALGMFDGLAEAARASGVRVLGPGSFGLCVPAIGLNASRAHLAPQPGHLALVSQSVSLCRAVLDWAEPNGVGFSHIVGIGGSADLGFSAALDWLARDSGTGAILLDIRRIKDRRRFLSAARAAARLRPVVAIRPGGRLADPTGLSDAVLEAALRRAGILSVVTLDDLLAAAETLTRAKPLRAEGLAILTNAIGPGRLAADAALRDGVSLASLSAETLDVLRMSFPGIEHGHALIYPGAETAPRLAEIAAMLAGAREIGGVLVVHAPTGQHDQATIAGLAAMQPAARVPLLVCAMGETTGAAHRRVLAEAGVPAFAAPEQAVRGFLHLVQDRRNRAVARELPGGAVLSVAPDLARARALFDGGRALGQTALPAEAAMGVLAAYGVRLSESSGEAPARRPLVRVGEDAMFGPFIALDLGGATTAIDLPPLNLPLARALIARAGGLDESGSATLAGLLVRVSQLVVDFPEIASMALDPLRAGGAAIGLRAQGAAPGQLAIAPYPGELEEVFQPRGLAEPLLIRPIRPEDARAHAALFHRLSPEDVRYRFFSAMRELSPDQIARMTQVDYDREMAFVAVRRGDTVGVSRLVCEPGSTQGEFAVVVQPDMKGHGLARHLMRRLIDWGRRIGLSEIVGQVLADNAPMLAFVRSLGFAVHRMEGEEDVMEVRLDLAPDARA